MRKFGIKVGLGNAAVLQLTVEYATAWPSCRLITLIPSIGC